MRSSRRSQLERYVDIIRIVAREGPVRQTHIMYKANLAWQELKKDLSALQAQGIIEPEVHKEGIFYRITTTGRDALEHFNRVASLLATTLQEEAGTRNGLE